jgi:hypothetical protein
VQAGERELAPISIPRNDRHKAPCTVGSLIGPLWFQRLVLVLCEVHFAFRSLLAHIRMQHAKGGMVDVGPALVPRDGCYQPNERTRARAAGIEKLAATYPWAGLPHFQTFLDGFDAGEEYSSALSLRRNNPDQSQTQMERQEPSFKTLPE